MVSFTRHRIWLAALAIIAIVGIGAWFRRDWMAWFAPSSDPTPAHATAHVEPHPAHETLELSPAALQNLGLVSRPLKLQDFWRTIVVPGEIIDRPGVSDRGVTAPAVGVVTQVHSFPGDSVHPGDRLFTLRLLSEYIQNSQSELFKATRETQLAEEQRARLAKVAEGGAIPQSRLIEMDQQLRRLQAAVSAYRQDLLTRGLTEVQLDQVTEGKFVASIDVAAPPALSPRAGETPVAVQEGKDDFAFELQDLKVDLGTQVQAGQTLAVLSNHQALYLAGHAFKREAPFLERAAQNQWPVQVEFAEDDPSTWPTLDQPLTIRHISNSIDPQSRTFEFFIALENQSRAYERDGRRHVVWRFRPGQRLRLHVPVEEMKDVFVLPAGAVVREGPEAYVFRQNGDLFDRLPVHVLYEDRLRIVLANGDGVRPGWYIAQGSAASLNRVLKAQSASGEPVGVHVHADGTVHGH